MICKIDVGPLSRSGVLVPPDEAVSTFTINNGMLWVRVNKTRDSLLLKLRVVETRQEGYLSDPGKTLRRDDRLSPCQRLHWVAGSQ